MNNGFCHNVKPIRQPTPAINSGGDCFACGTLAIMQHLFPDSGLLLRDIHKVFTVKSYGGSDTFANSWSGYDTVFHRLEYGDEDENINFSFSIETRRFMPTFNMEDFEHHNPAWYTGPNPRDYFWQIDALLRAGYLMLVEVDHLGRGPMIEHNNKLVKNHTDHVVVIDGARSYWPIKKDGDLSRSLQSEFHIVDSNKRHKTNEYWISVRSFLHDYGAAGFWMVRKSPIFYLEDNEKE